jgi:hypothetical protein
LLAFDEPMHLVTVSADQFGGLARRAVLTRLGGGSVWHVADIALLQVCPQAKVSQIGQDVASVLIRLLVHLRKLRAE